MRQTIVLYIIEGKGVKETKGKDECLQNEAYFSSMKKYDKLQ